MACPCFLSTRETSRINVSLCLYVCVSVCLSVCGQDISGSTVAIQSKFCTKVASGIFSALADLHKNPSLVRPGVGEIPFPVFTPPPFTRL